MTNAEPRVTALLDIEWRPAEAEDQKLSETLFGAREIMAGIHRSKDSIVRDLPVKGGDKAPEAVFANRGINILFFQLADRNIAAKPRRSER